MPDHSMPEEIRDRLTHIEEIAEDRPGEALEELEAVTTDLPDVLADRQEDAHARLRNEDFPGAAQVLTESALILQWAATLSLAVRECTRRRR